MKKIIVIFFVLLTACSGVPVSSEAPSESKASQTESASSHYVPQAPPPSKRKEIGRQFIHAALQEYEFVTDYEVVSQINRIGKDILQAMGEDPENFHFFIVRQNQLNAFAVPGGYIFFFDGLLKELGSIDALAGVMAHEIAHVQRDHFFKDQKKISAINLATMASLILAGLTGKNIGAAGVIGSGINISTQLKFSRKNEEDADLFAIKYLKQTDYNPLGLAEFFETLSFYAGFTRGTQVPYFSTHPGLSERRFMVETLMKDLPVKKKTPDVSTIDWRNDWGRLRAILGVAGKTSLSENLSDEEGLSDQGTDSAALGRKSYLSALAASRRGELQAASRDYQSAIESDPTQAIYHADLSNVWMQLQKADLAKAAALESIRLSEDHAIPYLVLGMIAQSESDHKAAVKYLESAKNRAPDHAFISLQLARSYYAIKIPAKEKFYLGRYHRLKLEPEKAMLNFQNALSLLDDRSPLAFITKREMDEIALHGV
ncbi:MAG: M48 family metalloprotease [Nitrospirae bacterium]|nr:M48 family metalloprotease [Candidatus Manganitrophaceae bacterium]